MWTGTIRRLQFRPWMEFYDYRSFNLPGRSDVLERVNVNLGYYQANYVALLAAALLYVVVRHPWFLLGLIAEIALFVYLFWYRTTAIVFASTPVSRRDLAIAYAALSTTVSIAFGGWTAVNTFAMALVGILLHAVFRTRSLKARGTAFIDMLTSKPHSDAIRPSDEVDGAAALQGSAVSGIPPSAEQLANQAQFKSQFRATMRAKYLNPAGANHHSSKNA